MRHCPTWSATRGIVLAISLVAGSCIVLGARPCWGRSLDELRSRDSSIDSILRAPSTSTLSIRSITSNTCGQAVFRADGISQHDRSHSLLLASLSTAPVGKGFEEFAGEDKDRVIVSRAALLSLVLPGAGQWYAGARGRAAGFLTAEGLLWAAFGFFETVGEVKKTDYRVYARVHAGIDPAGKGDDFYRTITFYDSREEYNDLARVFDPRRPYYDDVPYWCWQWDSYTARSTYRNLRNQSSEAFSRGKFTLGALVLNRLVAALDAIRTAKAVNRRARMETANWRIHIRGNPAAVNPRFAVTFSRQF